MKNKIFELFKKNNKELFLVGGCVRDQILNIETNDYDFATNATPQEIIAILKEANYKPYTIGVAFGTISIIDNGQKAEITTYRRNESYTKNNRHPRVEFGKSIEEDLARRDFTCNALALSDKNEIVDPYNGVLHISQKLLETPIEAEKSFSDDPLRLLRAVRFKNKFNFQYSEQVKQSLYKQAHKILVLSKERIVDEMNKILMLDNVDIALNDLFEYRLINYFIPELVALKNIEQNKEYHSKDALNHTINVVKNTPKDLVLRYSALFHDLGKMATFSVVNNKIHFYNHEEISNLMTQSILYRLKFSNKMIEDITYLVGNHMRCNLYSPDWSDSAIRRFINDTGDYCDKLITISEADITSHNPITVQKHLDDLNDLKRRIEEFKNFKEIKSPLNGKIIMQEFNLEPCRKIKEIKELLINALIEGKIKENESQEFYITYIKNNFKNF